MVWGLESFTFHVDSASKTTMRMHHTNGMLACARAPRAPPFGATPTQGATGVSAPQPAATTVSLRLALTSLCSASEATTLPTELIDGTCSA